ncbi:helix-turn-helix transcriptional regulator [Faecalitalea cylindroides]|uniref:helix-turn-helix transcriptional regulator n=1 Tax=Faecalitalea cylindroides TaxID=39483 RepID=UPI003AB57537
MGFRIKELREEKNWSQSVLAEKSGVSRNLIARLESGELTFTTTDTLLKLAKALGKKVNEIFLKMMFNALNTN